MSQPNDRQSEQGRGVHGGSWEIYQPSDVQEGSDQQRGAETHPVWPYCAMDQPVPLERPFFSRPETTATFNRSTTASSPAAQSRVPFMGAEAEFQEVSELKTALWHVEYLVNKAYYSLSEIDVSKKAMQAAISIFASAISETSKLSTQWQAQFGPHSYPGSFFGHEVRRELAQLENAAASERNYPSVVLGGNLE